ncbi:hypothetical protein U9M48_016980 [Paspalum notatum var. saurae]|uniref:RRM domain-containing protein n=1 Tax=Paspalum notatum var. saurae TaxID=547442 RepID=A0AAQ3T7U7_PASNO
MPRRFTNLQANITARRLTLSRQRANSSRFRRRRRATSRRFRDLVVGDPLILGAAARGVLVSATRAQVLLRMARNPGNTVFIGNLDEKVSERVLYEILIQAGHLVDLYIPCEKESNHPKGYAFAEYESEETAEYAVRLFSGLVRINGKTLRFAKDLNLLQIRASSISSNDVLPMAGQDKPSSNDNNPAMPKLNPIPSSNGNNPVTPKLNPIPLPKQTQFVCRSDMPVSHTAAYPVVNGKIAGYGLPRAPYPHGVHPHALSVGPVHNHGQVSNGIYDYSRQTFGPVLNVAYRGPVMNAFAHGAVNQTITHPSY